MLSSTDDGCAARRLVAGVPSVKRVDTNPYFNLHQENQTVPRDIK